ncbi:MAG: glycosyltransferase family 4 protein [Verrucomicrobiales bacterium]|nr:glycosyltransferase family 4 protein [Verrucomicrobiales bacterium]
MNFGFLSTRFAGTDGVSLEAAKWAEVLAAEDHQCFWFSGLNDRPDDISMCAEEAFFDHPQIAAINSRVWQEGELPDDVSGEIRAMTDRLKKELYEFTRRFAIDILIPENTLAIPMNIPLGVAITEYLKETGMPAIAHHHDFSWERIRFSKNCINEILDSCFPPVLPNLIHTVINSPGRDELKLRRNVESVLIPNVFDFETPPPPPDEYSSDARHSLGIADDDIFILQPTRVVPRKGIEHAIKLTRMLDRPNARLIISHAAGDEGFDYLDGLKKYAREQGVDFRVIPQRIGTSRGTDSDGRKIYTLWDLYPHCDLVTYPSSYEGFGNALLEAIYFRKPVIINRYRIFVTDIEPMGFTFASMDGEITAETVAETNRFLNDPGYRDKVVNENYEIARQNFSYSVLRDRLNGILGKIA